MHPRIKWHLAKHLNFSSPAHIDIELSTKCKLNCEFCFRKEYKYPAKNIDTNLVYDIFVQAKEMHIPSVKFNWRGEALNHPDWMRIFRLFKQAGFYTMLNTALADMYNGLELDTLAETIDNLKISFDSSAEAIYNHIRKGADFFQTLSNLDELIKFRKIYNMPKIILNRRTTTISEPDEAFKEFFGNEINYDIRPAIPRNKSNIYKWENIHYDLPYEINSIRKYCVHPSRRLVISENGFVYACCVAYALQPELYLGRLDDKPLKEIWNSEKRMSLINDLNNNVFNSACKNCTSGDAYK
jgi:radical SAM protein with 4Fe4S-binding SPASM domain